MRTLIATALAMLLVAAPAVAQTDNPTEPGYSTPAGTIQQQITSTPSPAAQVSPSPPVKVTPVATTKAAAATSSKSSGLPFTGLELGLVLAAGAGLLGIGLTLRRLSRPSQEI
jgi:hypothetical protein